MSGENDQAGQGEDTTIEARATAMGWQPKEKFKGAEGEFVDAESFVKKGEEILPILRANNRRLVDEVTGMKKTLTEAQRHNQELQASVEGLKEFQADIALERLKAKKKELSKAIKDARSEDNDDLQEELEEQLSVVNDAVKEYTKPAAKAATPPPAAEPPAKDPNLAAWMQENSWFQKDQKKTAIAIGIGQELRESGSPLLGREFLDEVARQTEEFFAEPRQSSKVESGRGGTRARSGKGFADLPEDAKTGCLKFEKNLVGPGKTYKTAEEWRTHYAKEYFASES